MAVLMFVGAWNVKATTVSDVLRQFDLSVLLGDEGLIRYRWADVATNWLSWWKFYVLPGQPLVGYLCQQVRYAVQPGRLFGVGVHHIPRCLFDVGVL